VAVLRGQCYTPEVVRLGGEAGEGHPVLQQPLARVLYDVIVRAEVEPLEGNCEDLIATAANRPVEDSREELVVGKIRQAAFQVRLHGLHAPAVRCLLLSRGAVAGGCDPWPGKAPGFLRERA
jgi:hypothetical protein